jgi:hypothetical protein
MLVCGFRAEKSLNYNNKELDLYKILFSLIKNLATNKKLFKFSNLLIYAV